jgi:hypothetical protein
MEPEPELSQRIDVLGPRIKFTRPRCPHCGEPFIGWREQVNEAMRVMCRAGHWWVTERYVDHGVWC